MGILEFAIVALIIALVAGALGFGGISAGAATLAKWAFALFLIVAAVLFVLAIAGVGAVA